MSITEAQRIRIAIAYVALRRKPKDVSIAAYVLDLREKFPISKDRGDASDEPWRDRALELEEEVNKLKRKYEEDLAELSVLRDSVRADNPTAKKKGKSKAASEGSEGSGTNAVSLLQSVKNTSEELRAEIAAPELSGSLNVFGSYHRLYQLTSALRSQSSTNHSSHLCQLLTSATNVLRALALTLDKTLHPENCLKVSPGFLKDFNVILCSTLSCTTPLFPVDGASSRRKAQENLAIRDSVDAFFSVLSREIIIPLVGSFGRISEAALVPVLSTKRQQKALEKSDTSNSKAVLRGLLAILKSVIVTLKESASSHTHKVLDLVRLVVISEIERLWEPPDSKSAGNSSPASLDASTSSISHCMLPIARRSRKERIYQLARKNALWYLCSVAHDVFPIPPTSRPEDGSLSDYIRERLDVTLSRLLVRCGSVQIASGLEPRATMRMDDVEKGMIVSVIENIWLHQ